MTDTPERIWATENAANFGEDRFHTTRPMKGLTEYIRADVAAAMVAAEREACAAVAMDYPVPIGCTKAAVEIAAAIRKRGQQ